jgi:O-methyltransferase
MNSVQLATKLPGAICEMGVAAGQTSRLIATEILETSQHLWLFDSFEGLPAPTDKDVLIDDVFGLGSIDAYKGTMCHPEESVRACVESVAFPKDRLHIIKGFVEETLTDGNLPEAVAFAFLDMDFYEPILHALGKIAGRLVTGGFIIIHDYGHFSAGAKAAVDEFARKTSQLKLDVPICSPGIAVFTRPF